MRWRALTAGQVRFVAPFCLSYGKLVQPIFVENFQRAPLHAEALCKESARLACADKVHAEHDKRDRHDKCARQPNAPAILSPLDHLDASAVVTSARVFKPIALHATLGTCRKSVCLAVHSSRSCKSDAGRNARLNATYGGERSNSGVTPRRDLAPSL